MTIIKQDEVNEHVEIAMDFAKINKFIYQYWYFNETLFFVFTKEASDEQFIICHNMLYAMYYH